MAKVNTEAVTKLIQLVGGKENIGSLTHCVTRLRFILNNNKIAQNNSKQIEELSMVKSSFLSSGQYQVVIGPEVSHYYDEVLKQTGLAGITREEAKNQARANLKWWEAAISHFADIFIPLLPAIISGGLILGFRNIIGDLNLATDANGNPAPLTAVYPMMNTINSFLWLIGEAIFHFLPVAIAWSTVKKMGGTPVLGIVVGITLVSPQLVNSYALADPNAVIPFYDFGIFQLEKLGYQAQVIPSILAAMATAYIERFLKRITPDYLYLVVVPVLTLLISVFLAHAIIGPIGRKIGDGVAWAVQSAMTGSFAPIGSAIFGFLYAPLVITGVHQTSLAIDFTLISQGGTPVWPIIALSNIAQASAVLGIIIISKKENEREVSVPAALSAYLGVTEPAMYGINLKYRFPMLCAMVGSAVAGLICGISGVLAKAVGIGGLPAILSIQAQYWGIYSIATIVAIVIPCLLTILVYKSKFRS